MCEFRLVYKNDVQKYLLLQLTSYLVCLQILAPPNGYCPLQACDHSIGKKYWGSVLFVRKCTQTKSHTTHIVSCCEVLGGMWDLFILKRLILHLNVS